MNRNKTYSSKRLAADLLVGTLLGLSFFGPARAEDPAPGVSDTYAADRVGSSNDLANLLPLFLTSQERRELAERLEASMRNGDMDGAESSLNTAIEVGTLAIVLAGQLRNPDLLATLQNLGIKGHETVPEDPAAIPANCSAPAALADLQQALDREQNYNGMISKTLTELMQENNALKARLETDKASQDSTLSDMQQTLQREREKSEASAREFAELRNAYDTSQAAPEQAKATATAVTAEWEARLQQERKLHDDIARQLANTEKELHTLQALKDEAAASQAARVTELEKTLARTQAQGEVLIQELTAANEELNILKEPHRPSATPLVQRIAKAGMDAPLPQTPEEVQPQETSALPQTHAKPETADHVPPAQGNASAKAQREPTPVVIASLPAGITPLPAIAAPADQPKAEDRLTIRADELLRKGDVSGARLLLERALDAGNARAAFLMGETFDPNVLAKLRVLGIRGDASKAREFYAQALALGMTEAQARMEALK